MNPLSFLFEKSNAIWLAIIGFIGTLLLKICLGLVKKNKVLSSNLKEQYELISLQKKEINVVKNHKNLDLEHNLKRMCKWESNKTD